jgi:hypothetical protein
MFEGKKTLFGLLLSQSAILFNQAAAVLDSDPATNFDLKVVVGAVVVIFGAADRIRRGGTPASDDVVKTGESVTVRSSYSEPGAVRIEKVQ